MSASKRRRERYLDQLIVVIIARRHPSTIRAQATPVRNRGRVLASLRHQTYPSMS
jgi:hypothetical protein